MDAHRRSSWPGRRRGAGPRHRGRGRRRDAGSPRGGARSASAWFGHFLPALLLLGLTSGFPAGLAAGQETTPDRCPTPVAIQADDPLLRWRAEPGLEGVARALAAQQGARRPMPAVGPLEEALPSRNDSPTVWLLRDLGCLTAHGITDVRADWVAGVASHDGNFIALRADGSRGDLQSLPAVFRHELAHLVLHEVTGGNAPRWLHEGYAQYAAGSWDWQQAWRLRFVFLTGGGDELRELSLGFPGDATGARTAYLLSYTAVQELAGLSGPRGLQAVFARLREGATMDEAIRRTFGITLDQFEERWRKRVGERYGILYMLSRATAFWVAVTVALLLLGWWRRRRDRQKLEQMREEERREAQMWEALSPGSSPGSSSARPYADRER